MIQSIKGLLILVIFTFSSTYSQDNDSLIHLYPGMEDTISYIDRTYFGLYNQIQGFEYATVSISKNHELISRVTFSDNGALKDTVFTNDFSILENIRSKMDQIIKENHDKIESFREVYVTVNNGNSYLGNLEGFSKNHLYLTSDKILLTDQDTQYKFRIPTAGINEVLILGESHLLTPVLWGAGIGFAFMLIPYGMAEYFEKAGLKESEVKFGVVIFGAILGAGIGFVVGLFNAEYDVPIKFNSDRSVLGLKDYAYYNFRNLKSLNKNYYEIK